MSLPRTAGGLIGWLITTVIMVAVGIYIIQRVGFISRLVYGKAA